MKIDSVRSDRLRDAALFASYSDAEIDTVLGFSEMRKATRGEIIFAQHDACSELFVLASGTVKLVRDGRAGRHKVVRLVLPGGTLGECALFSETYAVTAIAVVASDLLAVPAARYLGFLRGSSRATAEVLRNLGASLEEYLRHIEYLSTHTVSQKVAAFLLERSNGGSSASAGGTNCPRTEIANLLSIRPETLSRAIRAFRQRNWISVDKSRIIVTNPEGLRREVSGAPL